MKILDRYVLRSFLYNYVISFLVLIGLYIVLDMVFNFDELAVERKGAIPLTTLALMGRICTYYFYQTFLIFVHLSGIIPVVAAAFTLIRMSRFNELSAILAAGVPLLRLAAPIIIATVVLQGLLAADQELIIPNIVNELTAKHDEIAQQQFGKTYPIQAMQDDHRGLLFAGQFTPPTVKAAPMMNVVDIIERDENRQPVAHITADRAEWDAEQQNWKLTNGWRDESIKPQMKRPPETPVNVYQSNITPDEIALYHSGEFVNLLSLERINQLLQRPQIYGAINLLRVKHFRLLQLVMNVVMLLVAIPCVLTREPGRLKKSIFRCLVLVGLCMASYFVAYQIAGTPPPNIQWADRWPPLVAFAPLLVFGCIAIYLLDRLGTKDT